MDKEQSFLDHGSVLCPKCGSIKTVEILYGYIENAVVIEDESTLDEPYFGGCVVDTDSPVRHCNECGRNY